MGTLVGLATEENLLGVLRVGESLGITEKIQLRVGTLVTIIGPIVGGADLVVEDLADLAAHKSKRQSRPTKPVYGHHGSL